MIHRPQGQQGFSTGYGHESGRVYRMNLPEDPEAASMMSLDAIHAIAREGREDPRVRRKAIQIIRSAGVTDGRQTPQVIKSIFDWIQRNVFYVHDPAGVEFLTTPGELLDQAERGEAAEDCDSFVALAHALFNSVGRPTRSVIWKADRRAPNQWSHITLEVFDNKRWIPLDLIMKDKPLGWSPPQFYGKRVVPLPDGEPWPNGRPQSVDARPPMDPAAPTTSMGSFFAGASNWKGFGRYGDLTPMQQHIYDKTQTPPNFPACHEITNAMTLAHTLMQAGAAELDATGKPVPQGHHNAATWFQHLEGIFYQEVGPRFPYSDWPPKDVQKAQGVLKKWAFYVGGVGGYYGELGKRLAAEWTLAGENMVICAELNRDYSKTLLPYQEIGRILSEIKELIGIRNESMTYLEPLLAAVTPLVERATVMMGRIEDKQKFLEQVAEVVKITGMVLSALGAVTAGITELLNIVMQLGHLAYQMRQAAAMMSGSSAKTLGEIASALDAVELYANAALDVAEQADREIGNLEQLLVIVRENHPEWFPPDAVITAELTAATGVAPKSKVPIVLGVSAAAGLLAMVVL